MNSLFSGSVATPNPPRRALAALLLAAATLTSGAAAATTYQVIQLPLPPGTANEVYATGINEAGEIIGYTYTYTGSVNHAVAWSAAPDYTPRLLPEGGALDTHPTAINDAGYIVGTATTSPTTQAKAAMWTPNDGLILLGEPPGGQTGSSAWDINASRTVIGYVNNPDQHPAYWLTPVMAHVFFDNGFTGTFNMQELNDDGTIVGSLLVTSGRPRAVRAMRGGGMELLDELPGPNLESQANDVNEAGQAVGYVANVPLRAVRALLWNADGSVLDLGDLPGGSVTDYYADNINNTGEVTGTFHVRGADKNQAFLWTAATGMQSIIDLVDPLSIPLAPGDAIDIAAINDAGVMVGFLDTDDSPVPIPIVLVPQP